MTEKRHLKERLDQISRPQLMNVLAWIVAIAVCILIGAFWLYLTNFGPAKLSTDPAVWGQFGDFVGGAANPVIGLLTLIALVLTIVLQSKQLDLSTQELSETKAELRRSTEAQELAARLNALTALFVEYRRLSEDKEAEFTRVLSAPTTLGANVQLIEAVKRERDGLLIRKQQIFDELEKLSGLVRQAAQQSIQPDEPASGGSAG
ncbi:hypothetical protein SAMN04488068_1983 [Hydrocarboniphaga daqingensis]|uniref:Uncharacterized protein n=1 Tax=Hydrocarboniphaga daqingensis TaxID=490188 RepID=A0A1M5P241_9GAMM|nr:hypothetical protein [Hydrocarboniphaga daqingensis]SHG95871.1 hypothetical protein SAMN04488068_1983 [Hydrocarboniphaga daqingensis]